MGLNFRKTIKICKGVNLNVGTGGVSISGGVKGARLSMHSSGRKTATIGIPGTGLSYSKTFSGKKKTTAKKTDSAKKEDSKPAASTAAAAETTVDAATQVAQYESYISDIRSIHKTCDEQVNWKELYQSAPPFAIGSAGPKETEAKKQLDAYKPSFMEKLTGKAKKKQAELAALVTGAKEEDIIDYENWKTMKEFSSGVMKGDIDSYLSVIEGNDLFADLAEFGSDFEFGTEDPTSMQVEFRVKADEVVPTEATVLTPGKRLSKKALTKTQYYDYVQDYVCSCTIRLAREIFATLPVDTVLVHAVDGVLNPATGNMEDNTILSVRFTRDGFKNINFDRIDPSDFVTSFEYNMGFNKTSGFKPIKPLE